MDEQLRTTVLKLLTSEDIDNKRVGLNMLLNEQVELEERIELIIDMMKGDLDESLREDIHAV
jgi:hypothetical protein